jgi:hypothetical protein
MNLLKETIDFLKEYEKSPKDVLWVGTNKSFCSWHEFERVANIEYDDGYGTKEVDLSLKVVGQDFWLERHEYDGSEWWEFKTQPTKPDTYNENIVVLEK